MVVPATLRANGERHRGTLIVTDVRIVFKTAAWQPTMWTLYRDPTISAAHTLRAVCGTVRTWNPFYRPQVILMARDGAAYSFAVPEVDLFLVELYALYPELASAAPTAPLPAPRAASPRRSELLPGSRTR
jgi:hypothetical protein